MIVIFFSDCGWPGRPQYGQLKVKRQGFLLPPAPPPESHPTGDKVEYSCPTPGYRLYGSKVRECGEDGRWTNSVPFCGKIYLCFYFKVNIFCIPLIFDNNRKAYFLI